MQGGDSGEHEAVPAEIQQEFNNILDATLGLDGAAEEGNDALEPEPSASLKRGRHVGHDQSHQTKEVEAQGPANMMITICCLLNFKL